MYTILTTTKRTKREEREREKDEKHRTYERRLENCALRILLWVSIVTSIVYLRFSLFDCPKAIVSFAGPGENLLLVDVDEFH